MPAAPQADPGGPPLDGPGSFVVLGDCLEALPQIPDRSVAVAYLDPPFNTGTARRGTLAAGPPVGNRAEIIPENIPAAVSPLWFGDAFADYRGFLMPRLAEARRVLADDGTMYLHLDYREAHYAKVALDGLFGRDCFLNEIIWAYDYGGRSRRRWPAKHDTILVYVKDPERYYFDADAVDREPYMAPGLQSPERAARGKSPTDVWWHTIVHTRGAERTGYPTQKPEGVLRRIVAASSRPGDRVLDCFAGSGTTGAVAQALGRRFTMIDDNPQAVEVMRRRLGAGSPSAPVVYLDDRGGLWARQESNLRPPAFQAGALPL